MHLRLASHGLPTATANSHPFLAGGMAFAHNGSATPTSKLRPLVHAELWERLEGTTDSEAYFAGIRSRIAEGMALPDAVVATVRRIRTIFPQASLNAVLLAPSSLIVVSASATAPIPVHEFEASGIPAAELPLHNMDAYYQLWKRRLPDGTTVFSSTGLAMRGWTPVPQQTVTVVDTHTGAERVIPIAVGAEAPARETAERAAAVVAEAVSPVR